MVRPRPGENRQAGARAAHAVAIDRVIYRLRQQHHARCGVRCDAAKNRGITRAHSAGSAADAANSSTLKWVMNFPSIPPVMIKTLVWSSLSSFRSAGPARG